MQTAASHMNTTLNSLSEIQSGGIVTHQSEARENQNSDHGKNETATYDPRTFREWTTWKMWTSLSHAGRHVVGRPQLAD